MSSRGNIIFTIFGNSFITQDYTEKSEKIQSENIIGVRYVQLSGNMDYDDHRIVVRSFLASEIDLIWSFTMKKYLLTHLVLRRQVWSKKYCFPILLFLFFWKAKNKYLYCFIYFIQQTVLTPARIRLCLEFSHVGAEVEEDPALVQLQSTPGPTHIHCRNFGQCSRHIWHFNTTSNMHGLILLIKEVQWIVKST